MTHDDWLAAVIAAPHCPVTRAAFLDWLEETEPARCNRNDPWFRDFVRPDGRWVVERHDYGSPDGTPNPWTMLKWAYLDGSTGTAMTKEVVLPKCGECGGGHPNQGEFAACEVYGWRCLNCAHGEYEREKLARRAEEFSCTN